MLKVLKLIQIKHLYRKLLNSSQIIKIKPIIDSILRKLMCHYSHISNLSLYITIVLLFYVLYIVSYDKIKLSYDLYKDNYLSNKVINT